MDTNEVLQFVDESLYAKTGKRLNDLQRQIIKGVLNRQKYEEMADDFGRSEGHVKDVGYELLKMLSEIFEEPVSKKNFQSVLERQKSFNFSFGDKSINSNIVNCITFGSDEIKDNLDKNKSETVSSLKNNEIMKINKLKQRGFSDQEIADILELSLDAVENIDSVEFDDV